MQENLLKLYNALKEKPYEFSFFQACFLLEKQYNDLPGFTNGTLYTEPIKLTPYIYASTPHSTCIEFDLNRNVFKINAPALIGYNGVLPSYYTEKIFFQEKDKNFFLSDFFNIFHHRYFAIKYKLEKTYSQVLEKKTKFKEVLSITGLANLKDTQIKNNMLPFVSLLTHKTKTTNNLLMILQNLINASVQIKEFHPKWFSIPNQNQIKLNRKPFIDKALGKETLIYHACIQIILTFDSFKEYIQYIKNKDLQTQINKTIKYFLNKEIEFEITLKIKKPVTRTIFLTNINRLGIDTWI